MFARVFWLLLVAGLALILIGCERDAPLSLLTVREVAPRDVEVGERLEIAGSGFPRGRTARVVMRGTLHRPGAAPLGGFEAWTEGAVTSDSRIEVVYDERLQSLFCGAGERAVHTTFRGQVTVGFAAAVPGAPPASAVLGNVVLDLRPPIGKAASIDRLRESGERLIEAAGLAVDRDTNAPIGLLAGTVRPQSAAERAGLLPGDLIVSFDGLDVRSAADLVPAPGAHRVRLGVRRGGDPAEHVVAMELGDYRRRASPFLLAMATLLAAAAALALFAPSSRPARWLARRASRGFALATAPATEPHPALWRALPLIAIPVAIAVPLLLRAITGTEPEMLTIALGIVAASLVSEALLAAPMTAAPTLGDRIARAFAHTAPLLPSLAALAAGAFLTGTARASEASHVQGGLPWDFVAFRGAANLAVLGAAIVALCTPELASESFGRTARIRRTLARSYVFALAALLVASFLGGWQSPFGDLAGPAMSIGALLFVAKATVVGAMALGGRTVLPVPGHAKRALVVLGAAAAVMTGAALSAVEARMATAADAALVAYGISFVALLAGLRAALLVIRAWRTPAPRLDPFA